MTKTIEDLFVYIAISTGLIPVLLFLRFFAKAKHYIALGLIVAYCIIEFTTNIISFHISPKTFVQVYSIFTILEYFCFTACIYSLIRSSLFKKIIIALSLGFLIFAIFYFAYSKHKSLDSIPIGVETILILFTSFYFLYEQVQDLSTDLIYNRFAFWIASGIMIYLAGSFFIYIFANQVDTETLNQYWILTNVFTTIKNLCFTISFLVFNSSYKKHRISLFSL
jgi:hypothetical protein